MPKIFKYLALAVTFSAALVVLPAAAFAQAGGDVDPLELLRPLWLALSGGNYQLAAAGVVVLLGAVLTRWGAHLWSWFATGSGRAAIVLLTAFGAALFAAVQAGADITLGVLWAALKLGVAASGVYSLAKALVLEPLQRWVGRGAPAPIRYLTLALGWVLNRVAPPVPAPAADLKLEYLGEATIKGVRASDPDRFAAEMAKAVDKAKADKS